MKKLILFFFLLSSIFCFGQNRESLKDVPAFIFYGVDYSLVKVYGATESPERFKEAFGKINQLFITEPNKYDVSKFLGVDIKEISLDAVNSINENIILYTLKTTNKKYTLDEKQISEAIKSLPVTPSPYIGIVFVAELLNKSYGKAHYYVVYFNTETKEIININPVIGKAGGAGLRNFWAASIYNSLKKFK